MKSPDHSIALVTGGGTGIGAAVARRLAERGASVVITGRHEHTLRSSAAQHPNIHAIVADITRPADVARTIDEMTGRHRRLDVLVNNAGIAPMLPLVHATPEHARELFDTNVLGLVEMTRRALPLLTKNHGSIINIASVVADQPFPNMSLYAATKAAVVALTRSWAQELALDGVRVNVVSPGPIETPLYAPDKLKMTPTEIETLATEVLRLVPSKRFGKPEEVAEVIAFLASPAASYVSGAQYTVAGGLEA